MTLWTDYPFAALGDTVPGRGPWRRCVILYWNGDKYIDVLVEGRVENIKRWYVYRRKRSVWYGGRWVGKRVLLGATRGARKQRRATATRNQKRRQKEGR